MPTPSRVITSNFGARWGRVHKGLDIKVYIGDTIRAAFSGKVRIVRYEAGGYGNYVVIDHGGGLTTLYAHMSVVKVSPGDTVSQGTVIGVTGNTGASTGPHLHYEVRTTTSVNGKRVTVYQNPLNYLPGYIAAW